MHKIEKKYLLKDNIKTLVNDLQLESQKISEFYTVVKVCKEVKFSKIDSKYFKTIKNGILGSIDQNRFKIKKAQYLKEKKNSIGKKTSKQRYLISKNSQRYAIDIYQKNLNNLYILEITFKTKEGLNKFVLPEIFKDYIEKEVTSDKRYQNRNLALLGDPKKNPYNIYSIFKDIELARITDLSKTIFKEMKTSDSVRIVLYKLFIELRMEQDLIVQTKGVEGLKAFEKALKKSIILINEYKNIFDKKMVQNVKSHLKVMNSALKTYKDLQFIQKELDTISPLIESTEMDRIYNSIEYKLSSERHNISRFFTTREFAIIFKQYELLLKENNKSFLSIPAQTSIKNSLKHKIERHYKKAIKKCEKYDSCEDSESYEAINSALKVLKTLLEEFKMVINKDNHKVMYVGTDNLSKELTTLKNINKKKMIIDTYLANLEVKPFNYDKLLREVEKKHKTSSAKKSQKLHKYIESFKKKKHLFK